MRNVVSQEIQYLKTNVGFIRPKFQSWVRCLMYWYFLILTYLSLTLGRRFASVLTWLLLDNKTATGLALIIKNKLPVKCIMQQAQASLIKHLS
jgi:hypothetical protein